MGGGLMQLVAYGAQDIYLTGNPQITFFKVVYRRYTNFAIEAIEQTVNGTAALGKKFSVTVARNGDLLSRVYLEIEWAFKDRWWDNVTITKLIDYVEVEIGGQCIDKQYGEWMGIWCDLTSTAQKRNMLEKMIKVDGSLCSQRTYLPLQFWFCRNPGLALPLIALQYHEVKLNVKMAYCPQDDKGSGNAEICNLCVYCDYVFLDTDERRRFAQVSHEYLIEQVQFSNDLTIDEDACNSSIELRFNHPVKELMWIISNTCDPCKGSTICANTCLIQLNGHDRFRTRQGDYFRDVQRWEHHTGSSHWFGPKYVHLYSFALKPEEHQPSGTCNFSRIDNAVLVQTFNAVGANTSVRVYAVNYNVLRIMSGMGGLAYSN